MENIGDTSNKTPTTSSSVFFVELKHSSTLPQLQDWRMKKYTVYELNKMSDYPSNQLLHCCVKYQSESSLCGVSTFFYTNKILCI